MSIDKTRARVFWGKIRDQWNQVGGSQGKPGYPTGDEASAPGGVKKSTCNTAPSHGSPAMPGRPWPGAWPGSTADGAA